MAFVYSDIRQQLKNHLSMSKYLQGFGDEFYAKEVFYFEGRIRYVIACCTGKKLNPELCPPSFECICSSKPLVGRSTKMLMQVIFIYLSTADLLKPCVCACNINKYTQTSQLFANTFYLACDFNFFLKVENIK